MRINWRTFVGLGIVWLLFLACTPAAPTAAPTKPGAQSGQPAAAPTSAVAATKPAGTASQPTAAVKTVIKRGGQIRAAATGTYDTLDNKVTSLGATMMWILLSEPLVRYDLVDPVGKFEVKPELAESWRIVDPKTIEFKLRKGVKFHDGSDFDAAAAKHNIDRALNDPKTSAKLLVDDIATTDAVDSQTLRLNLKYPSAPLLVKLSFAWGGTGSAGAGMLSKAAYEKWGSEIGSHPVGTGPFQLDQWLRDDRVILKKFDGYWQNGADGKPLPYFDRFEERWMPDQAVSLLEMKAGNLEILQSLEGKDIAGVKANPSLVYWELPVPGTARFTLLLSPDNPPFNNNLKLRQSALYAIDRDAMAKVLGFGVATPLYYLFWTKGQLGYDESLPRYDYQPDKAKQLLAEAGYPNGLDVTLEYINRAEDQRIAEIAKDMWDKVGIRTKLSGMERLAFVSKVQACNFEAVFSQTGSSPDPDGHSRLVVSGGNSTYICHPRPEIDQCMLEGRSEYDPAKRHEIYKRCIQILYEYAHDSTGYTRPENYVHPTYLKGARAQWSKADLKEAWLDK